MVRHAILDNCAQCGKPAVLEKEEICGITAYTKYLVECCGVLTDGHWSDYDATCQWNDLQDAIKNALEAYKAANPPLSILDKLADNENVLITWGGNKKHTNVCIEANVPFKSDKDILPSGVVMGIYKQTKEKGNA